METLAILTFTDSNGSQLTIENPTKNTVDYVERTSSAATLTMLDFVTHEIVVQVSNNNKFIDYSYKVDYEACIDIYLKHEFVNLFV